jgi:hypothetical protein
MLACLIHMLMLYDAFQLFLCGWKTLNHCIGISLDLPLVAYYVLIQADLLYCLKI